MFYREQCVKSPSYGLGVVMQSGDEPRVRFLNGGELPVDAGTLQVVPGQVYDAEVENRRVIEWWLSLRVYGINEPLRSVLPRPPFDAVEALRQSIIPEPFLPEASNPDRSRQAVTSTSGCWPFDCGNDGRMDEFVPDYILEELGQGAAAADIKSDTCR